MIHIGQLIKTELERQERTPTWLARKINCDRTNIYRIFERESIDTALLSRISTALNRRERASSCDDGGATWFFSSYGGILEL